MKLEVSMMVQEEQVDFGIDFKKELNTEQYLAVTAGDKPALVLAGAGSGKTRTLTYRVAYLLSQGVRPWEILLLTFTNKAAKEMLGRVELLTGVSKLQFWGGTFHSIGQRILRQHCELVGLEKNFTILDEEDAESVLSEVIKEKDGEFLKSKENPKAKIVMGVMSYARNTCQSVKKVFRDQYPFFEHLVSKVDIFYEGYQKKKKEKNVTDFDDLLVYWLEIMEKNEEVAAKYQSKFKHILVDEYQDTNLLQSKIIDILGVSRPVMAVGDDAQCIYTWRGANFENVMTFQERYKGGEIYKIETNYRSTPEILKYANAVLMNQPENKGFYKELKSVKRSHQKPYVVCLQDSMHQAGFIVDKIVSLVRSGTRKYRDIAVLYRAHYQSMDIQLELTRRGMPFTITSGLKFFEQAHIKDVTALLRFVWNSSDSSGFYRIAALLPRVGGRTAEKLLKLAEQIGEKKQITKIQALSSGELLKSVPEEAKGSWQDMVSILLELEKGMKKDLDISVGGVNDMEDGEEVDLFNYEEKKVERMERDRLRAEQKTRTMKLPVELVEFSIYTWYGDFMRQVYANWEERKEDLEGLISFAARFEDVGEFLSQIILLNADTPKDSDKAEEEDSDSIRLTTVHQAKGLEYPVVFVIGLGDGLFPIKRAIDSGDVSEERRLFYVAVTRAEEELYLTYPVMNTQGAREYPVLQSRFLGEVPVDLYQTLYVKNNTRGYSRRDW